MLTNHFESLRPDPAIPVRLTFTDGEEVEAHVLALDAVRDMDITYEVLCVLKPSPTARGTAIGATCIAPLAELAKWEPVGRQA